jgi:nitrogen regulatory protein P-II 1
LLRNDKNSQPRIKQSVWSLAATHASNEENVMFMLMLVLDDITFLDQILEAWSNLGVSGVTIVESNGLYRRHQKHIPMRYAYGETSETPLEERGNSTLFAIVENEQMSQVCLKEVEKIVGDLDGPNTGVFAAWPLATVKGVPSRRVN